MDVTLNPDAAESIMAMARKKLPTVGVELVNYIKSVKLSKGRRGQGDVLSAGEPPYGGQANKLKNSVLWRWKEGDPNTIEVGTEYFVGLVQEVGAPGPGVAQPVGKHGLMTIPRSDEAIKHRDSGGSARSFPKKLTLIPSTKRRGIYFLVETLSRGRPKRTIIHYVLAKSVRIPPHPWLVPSLNEFGPQIMRILSS